MRSPRMPWKAGCGRAASAGCLLLAAWTAAFLGAASPARAVVPGRTIAPDPAFALPKPDDRPGATVDSASLVENAAAWNGRTISFTGEAVGELMVRGDRAWIHLNDDAYMWKNIEEGATLGGYNSGHAIWVPAAQGRRIAWFGDYKHEGDIIKVTGVFHAACPLHGGDMDIHADFLEVVRPGHPVGHVVDRQRAFTALLLLALAGLFWWLRRMAALRRI